MVAGLKIGAKVRALCGPFKGQAGVVRAQVGTGRSRKWKVGFDSGLEGEFSARALDSLDAPKGASKKPRKRTAKTAQEHASGSEESSSSESQPSEDGGSDESSDEEGSGEAEAASVLDGEA